MMKSFHSTNKHHAGFTLIEVMVALVIFSVGLLGLAGLQMGGMRSNHGAMLRTIATQHVYNMADHIRSSRAGFNVSTGAGSQDMACIDGGACNAITNNFYDIWITEIGNTLPSGRGIVSNVGGGAVRVSVHWDEDRTGVTGTTCPPNANSLQCIQITFIP